MCLDTWSLSDSFRNDFVPLVPVTQLWGHPWHTLDFASHAVLVLTDTGHSSSHSAPTVLPSQLASSHPALYGNLSAGFSDSALCPFHPKHKIPAILWNHKPDLLLFRLPWRLLFTDRNSTGVDQNGDVPFTLFWKQIRQYSITQSLHQVKYKQAFPLIYHQNVKHFVEEAAQFKWLPALKAESPTEQLQKWVSRGQLSRLAQRRLSLDTRVWHGQGTLPTAALRMIL